MMAVRDDDRNDEGYPRGPQQVIERHYHHGDSGKGSEARLNSIILGIAAVSLSIIMGFFGWQLQRMIEKVDAMSIRLSVVEVRLAK
jgi:hypothetical protein